MFNRCCQKKGLGICAWEALNIEFLWHSLENYHYTQIVTTDSVNRFTDATGVK